MGKFDSILYILKDKELIQTKSDWAEDLPKEIWDTRFKGQFEVKATGLHVDTRRWYETSVDVIKIHGRFLGIRYITNIFSETSSYEDCYHSITFFEMEEKMKPTYEVITGS